MREFLVIVRAGDRSLHPHWLQGAESRRWDLVVNYYGDNPTLYRDPGITRIDGKGPKWPALHSLLTENPNLVENYRYIWLPDDDLMASAAAIARLFEICEARGLEAAQPALTWDSHISHAITLRTAGNLLRYTNFVEIMAPCLSRDMLRRALPLFARNQSGWGLDLAWHRLAERKERGLAIIDAVTVRHTRPVGGPNYKTLQAQGISPHEELRAMWRWLGGGDSPPPLATFAVLTKGGRLLESRRRWRYALRMADGLAPAMRRAPRRKALVRELARQFWHNLNGRPVTMGLEG